MSCHRHRIGRVTTKDLERLHGSNYFHVQRIPRVRYVGQKNCHGVVQTYQIDGGIEHDCHPHPHPCPPPKPKCDCRCCCEIPNRHSHRSCGNLRHFFNLIDALQDCSIGRCGMWNNTGGC